MKPFLWATGYVEFKLLKTEPSQTAVHHSARPIENGRYSRMVNATIALAWRRFLPPHPTNPPQDRPPTKPRRSARTYAASEIIFSRSSAVTTAGAKARDVPVATGFFSTDLRALMAGDAFFAPDLAATGLVAAVLAAGFLSVIPGLIVSI